MITPGNRNLSARMRGMMYSLKRSYGGSIDIYKNLGNTTDAKTGIKTVNKDVTNISRAIILPAKVAREDVRAPARTAAGRDFAMGGYYDSNTRLFLVEIRDAPGLNLTEDDWIVFNGSKFTVSTFEVFEFHAFWAITAKQIVGEPFEQIFVLTADSLLEIQTTAGS
jgi:hypothetical protein